MNITLVIDQDGQVVNALTGFEAELMRDLSTGMHKAVNMTETAVSGFTPVNTGALRGSTTTNVMGTPASITGEVVTDIVYGWPVEEGRRPGKMPPVSAIELWVRRKLGISGTEARQVAYVVARAIGKRGTRGAYMFKQGFEQVRPAIISLFERIVDEATRAFNR